MLQSNPQLEHFRLIKRAVTLTCNELKDDAARQLMVTSVREGVVVINREPVTVRRVYVSTDASNRLMDVGWVLHDGLLCCLSCHVNFTVLSRKHHCRACGSLICKQCSTLATLIGFSTLPAQIVCKTCNPQVPTAISSPNVTHFCLTSILSFFSVRKKGKTARPDQMGHANLQDTRRSRSPALQRRFRVTGAERGNLLTGVHRCRPYSRISDQNQTHQLARGQDLCKCVSQ